MSKQKKSFHTLSKLHPGKSPEKSPKLDFHSGKTVDQPVPRREPRDSPRTASTGETPLEKMGGGRYYSRRAEVLVRRSMFLRLVSGLLSALRALPFLAALSGTLTCPHPPLSQAFRAVGDA